MKCDLTDVTAETHNPADPFESADVQGLLAGDGRGRHARFTSSPAGCLTPAPNSETSAVPGQPNLYLWRQERGRALHRDALPEEDFHDWGRR